MPCSKIHKTSHENEHDKETVLSAPPVTHQQELAEQPPTQSDGQSKFEGFEEDLELKRLLSRFPHLRHELQLVYGVTIEPGPDEAHTWARQKWLDDGSAQKQQSRSTRSRGGRGRGRGGFRGGYQADELPFGERQHGPWTQSKGDKQGLDLIRKLQDVSHPELSEGMLEFVRLCALRFG